MKPNLEFKRYISFMSLGGDLIIDGYTTNGLCAGLCCQECVAKTIELDTRASWDREDSDLCCYCVPSGKAGPRSGKSLKSLILIYLPMISQISWDCLCNFILYSFELIEGNHIQVLVCAPSNVAVDQLAEKISATGLKVCV
jgi:hypothetical protein